jgi:hypothetical protein
LDYYDLSGYLTGASEAISVALADARCLSDVGPVRIVAGQPDHEHTSEGLYDVETGTASHDLETWTQLITNKDTDHYLAKLWQGNTRGYAVSDAVVRLGSMPWGATMGAAQTLGFGASGSAHLGHGVILEPKGSITANGNRTGVNQGVKLVDVIYAVTIRCFADTFTSFTVKIQESQNDGGADAYADVAGLSQSVTGVGTWRLTTTAALEAWKRVVIADWIGTSADISVTGVVVRNVAV